jgi:hypothetical protein
MMRSLGARGPSRFLPESVKLRLDMPVLNFALLGAPVPYRSEPSALFWLVAVARRGDHAGSLVDLRR